jgi:CDP-4-dehydro-6-deoxyglucose reductase
VEKGNFSIGISSKAVLPDDERLQKYALACKTYPASDLEVIVGRRP